MGDTPRLRGRQERLCSCPYARLGLVLRLANAARARQRSTCVERPAYLPASHGSPRGSSLRPHVLSTRAQARRQVGQPPPGAHIADRQGAGLRLPDEDDELLAPCDTGV